MKQELVKFMQESAEWLWDNRKIGGCCHFPVTDRLQLSVGWTDIGEETEGKWVDGHFEIAAALTGRNPKAILETDLDWMTMPYCPETGDVWDTRHSLAGEDLEWLAEWFLKESKDITTNLEMGLLKEI